MLVSILRVSDVLGSSSMSGSHLANQLDQVLGSYFNRAWSSGLEDDVFVVSGGEEQISLVRAHAGPAGTEARWTQPLQRITANILPITTQSEQLFSSRTNKYYSDTDLVSL